MLGIGLKLLGIGKFLKDFFLQNWKWLVPLLLIIAGFLWTKEHYYNLGEATEKAAWEERIKKETEKNQKLTQALTLSVSNYGILAAKLNEARTQKETVYQNRIDTIIKEKPIYTECKVDQEILDAQNSIKALGPTP